MFAVFLMTTWKIGLATATSMLTVSHPAPLAALTDGAFNRNVALGHSSRRRHEILQNV